MFRQYPEGTLFTKGTLLLIASNWRVGDPENTAYLLRLYNHIPSCSNVNWKPYPIWLRTRSTTSALLCLSKKPKQNPSPSGISEKMLIDLSVTSYSLPTRLLSSQYAIFAHVVSACIGSHVCHRGLSGHNSVKRKGKKKVIILIQKVIDQLESFTQIKVLQLPHPTPRVKHNLKKTLTRAFALIVWDFVSKGLLTSGLHQIRFVAKTCNFCRYGYKTG